MNSKERLMCALNGEKPDRLPVTVHQWQKFHLDTYLNGISDIEAFERFGMDAAVQYWQDMGHHWGSKESFKLTSTKQWQDEIEIITDEPHNKVYHHRVVTPEGALTYKTGSDGKTTWITEYIIKKENDIYLIEKYMPVHKLDLDSVAKLYDIVADRGILRGIIWGDQAGCWQHAACLIDVTELIIRTFTNPQWVHDLLNILLAKKLEFISSMKGAKFDLVETGGGAGSSTLISPKIHEKFCQPYDKKIHDALHNLSFKTTYHICGGTYGIEEMIIKNGTNAIETLAPKSIGSNQEPWELKEKVGNRVALIGGIDQFNILSEGTPEDIRTQVKILFDKVGHDGGYILSCSDHFFDVPPDNLQIYADAAHECTYK